MMAPKRTMRLLTMTIMVVALLAQASDGFRFVGTAAGQARDEDPASPGADLDMTTPMLTDGEKRPGSPTIP